MTTFIATHWSVLVERGPLGDITLLFDDREAAEEYADVWSIDAAPYWAV